MYPDPKIRMKYIILAVFLISSIQLSAQVEIVAEQDHERNLTLIAFNKEKIPYTIQIEFLKLENLESLKGNIILATADPGKTDLVKLQSIYSNEKTGFQYNTKLFKGNFQETIPSNLPYLIPGEADQTVKISPLSVQYSHPSKKDSYTGVGFYFEEETSIVSPRKGIVSEMKMDLEANTSGPSNFDSENYIEIYHEDGTFSRLSGLKKNSETVAVGELVYPGQVIATSELDANQSKQHVKMVQSRWEFGEKGMTWVNFPVNIFTEDGTITSSEELENIFISHPMDLITQEMDKKELKKFQKN